VRVSGKLKRKGTPLMAEERPMGMASAALNGRPDDPSPWAKPKVCLVTGGAGYTARNLVKELLGRGYTVHVFDRVRPRESDPRVKVFLGDLCHFPDVLAASQGVDTVFHVASILTLVGFADTATRKRAFDVNVEGTKNVVRACVQVGAERLVYTSSNNVVFDRRIENGDETLPYATRFVDLYTETKILAEKEVLAANGKSGLLTCALRPGGIYGPGEEHHLPRMVKMIKEGRIVARVGEASTLADNVYIDNLVAAHIAAAEKLYPESPACGQAYFVTDGDPTHPLAFWRPVIEGLGGKYPTASVPAFVMYTLAYLLELAHWLIKAPTPYLSRIEVNKVTVTHWFSIDKARRDLGWTPAVSTQDALARCLPYCRELLGTLGKADTVERPHLGWWVSILVGMTVLGILAFNGTAYHAWHTHVTTYTPPLALRITFVLAVALHLGDAIYALRLAKRIGLGTAWGWFLQTLALGYPSLRLLKKRVP
jgi:3beta-hydroxy-delta5-steroid dehydrogenase/steroid delta-isomerase